MELNHIPRLGPVINSTLNPEEHSGLEVAMLQRKLQENLNGKMFFWGKIYGNTQDYLIVYNINPFSEFPVKKFYFSTTSQYTLKAFPSLSEDYSFQASKITSAFTGDPSFFAYNGEEEEEEQEDPDAPPIERFREIHRLAYTVQIIDHDCSIIPRGAYVIDATKKVIQNLYFQGLSFNSAAEPRSYMHFRQPESLQAKALMKRPGVIKSGDFLDCIDKDFPQGIWTIGYDDSGTTAHVRNLYWDGYGFYNTLNTSEYGSAYFGTGVPNYDIAFML